VKKFPMRVRISSSVRCTFEPQVPHSVQTGNIVPVLRPMARVFD